MQMLGGDEDDRESGGSVDDNSENDQDDHADDRDDLDIDRDAEPEDDVEGDGEGDDDNDDNEDEDDEQDQDDSQDSFTSTQNRGRIKPPVFTQNSMFTNKVESRHASIGSGLRPSSAPTSHPNSAVLVTSSSSSNAQIGPGGFTFDIPKTRPEMLTAPVYDIVPTIAAPHSTSINAICALPDLRWVFSGGADGYIRKFDWHATANGKAMLTVAQRHPFVDSVTKAGVLVSYWENEDSQTKSLAGDDGPALSAVYSLAVHREALWLLSGLESGGINLQTVRHDEGKLIHCLRKHTSAVSVLSLAQDERSVLSGSWDKTVIDWDLDTGGIKRSFEGSGGQISALEMRPLSNLPVPEVLGEVLHSSNTLSTNNSNKPRTNGSLANGVHTDTQFETSVRERDIIDDGHSPTDSLFGGNDADSLFGDDDGGDGGPPSGGEFLDDGDDELSRAIATELQQQKNDGEEDVNMADVDHFKEVLSNNGISDAKPASGVNPNGVKKKASFSENGLPHAEDLPRDRAQEASASSRLDSVFVADSTFLAASFDGSIRVWDKRQPTAVAKITPRNVPPWCMNACWSPDGNFIYAGRRNGTVEEFSLHKGLRGVERSFKLPEGSGPVSAVRAMPNGRHLICASYDILRLYDLHQQQTFKHSAVPFLIVPGHRTGVVSQLYIDPTCRYMISTAGNRGWEGSSTEVLLGYEIGVGK